MKSIKTIILLALLLSVPLRADAISANDLTALDISNENKSVSIADGSQATVVIILGAECPISRRMLPRMKELAKISKQKDVAFYGVFSDSWTTLEGAKKFQKEYEVDFPLLLDNSVSIAKHLKSGVKPEAFVFDEKGELIYRGRIDNRFVSIGRLRNTFDKHDLLNAITAAAEGVKPEVSETPAIGCVYNDWS